MGEDTYRREGRCLPVAVGTPGARRRPPTGGRADRLCRLRSTSRKGSACGKRQVRRPCSGAAGCARCSWHDDGMARIRLSTTVDALLLAQARNVRTGITDAALVDEALSALLARYRSAEVDASYAAYDKHPLDEPDEWGDLASFRRAAASS